jgi:hypothetical protein
VSRELVGLTGIRVGKQFVESFPRLLQLPMTGARFMIVKYHDCALTIKKLRPAHFLFFFERSARDARAFTFGHFWTHGVQKTA